MPLTHLVRSFETTSDIYRTAFSLPQAVFMRTHPNCLLTTPPVVFQTIAETNYRFEFVLGVSACLKNSTAHRYSCSATTASPLSDCRVTRLWTVFVGLKPFRSSQVIAGRRDV